MASSSVDTRAGLFHRFLCVVVLVVLALAGALVSEAAAPGGVLSHRSPRRSYNLELWLRSDAGTSSSSDQSVLTTWLDQSGNFNHGVELINPPVFKDNALDNVNFNPVVEFDGLDDRLGISLAELEGNQDYSLYVVAVRDDDGMNPVIGSNLGQEFFAIGFGDRSYHFQITPGGSPLVSTAIPSFDDPASVPAMLGGVNGQSFLEFNGMSYGNVHNNGVFPAATDYYVGRRGSEYFNGRICEVIAYSGDLPTNEHQRVKSYLAIKYGISLAPNIVPQSYLDSNRRVLWDPAVVGATYDEDVTAIGQDDGSALNQTISKNGSSDAIVTIGESGGGMDNGEFLFWSNDGGAITFDSADVPGGIAQRLAREWFVKETGEVGSVDVVFDLSGIDLAWNNPVATDFQLLVDADGTFAAGAVSLVASSFENQRVTFSQIDESLLNDGVYFTLGCAFGKFSPGGVREGIHLWLKADTLRSEISDGLPVTNWIDQTGNQRDATGSTQSPLFKDNGVENINFNPVVDFDGLNDELTLPLADLVGSADYSFFAVSVRDRDGIDPVIGSTLEFRSFVFGFTGSPGEVGRFSYKVSSLGFPGFPSVEIPLFNDPAPTPTLLAGIGDHGVIDVNGTRFGLMSGNGTFPSAFTYYLGRSQNFFYGGRIAEVVVYSNRLDPTQEAQVKSYLAIKYGISIGQNQGAQDYLDSRGNVIWDASMLDPVYHEDITAIGLDDASELNQTQSRNGDRDAIVTMVETGGGMEDGEFLFWSNDGGSVAFDFADVPGGISRRLVREWVIQETGEVGTVDLVFDLSGIRIPWADPRASDFNLLVDGDGEFATGASSLVASSFSGGLVTFSGVGADILGDGVFFTLGCVLGKEAPGGVLESIHLWLKADSGTSTTTDGAPVNTWIDWSGGLRDATESANPPRFKNNGTDNINFNPTIEFDGVNDQLVTSLTALEGSTDYSFYSVSVGVDASANPVLGSDLGPTFFAFGYGADSIDFGASASGSSSYSHSLTGFDDAVLNPGLLSGINERSVLEWNGVTVVGDHNNDAFPDATEYFVGRSGDHFRNGRISEIIVYNSGLSAEQDARVKSYLAIKYGISLGQNLGAQDYLDSSGNVVWEASAGSPEHNQDIAGIGQDNGAGLYQTRSKSASSDALVTMAEAEIGGQIENAEFLFWSNNGGERAFTATDVPNGIDLRLGREWVVQETGEVGSLDISFDLAGVDLPEANPMVRSFFLLMNRDGNFASGASRLVASGFSGNEVTFTEVKEDLLDDGVYYTLGWVEEEVVPGGVSDSILMWLKADASGTTTENGELFSLWEDQSGLVNDASEGINPPRFLDNPQDNINFNPVVHFDGVDDRLLNSLRGLEGSSDYSFFSVSIHDKVGRNVVLGSDLGPNRFYFGFTISLLDEDRQFFSFQASANAPSGRLFRISDISELGQSPALLYGINSRCGVELNGTSLAFTNPANGAFPEASAYFIGQQQTGAFFSGRIAEVIVFAESLSLIQEAQVKSYLAIKYGISLGQGSSSQDYLDSVGRVIWDASAFNADYDQGITAIGQDNGSGLKQTQSRNGNGDAIVTISERGGGMEDGEFFFWSHDGGALSFGESDVPLGLSHRLTREWLVQETGEVGAVDVRFDLSGVTLPPNVSAPADFHLIVDGDGVFASKSMRHAGSSFSGDEVIFSGINQAVLNDGAYFSLGVLANANPSAVDDNINRVAGTGVFKILIAELLGNDSDPEGDSVSLVPELLPLTSSNGSTLSILSGGRWILYTPVESAPIVNDTFTYSIEDSLGASDMGEVTIVAQVPNAQTSNNVRAAIDGDDIILEFRGIPGRRYEVQYTTSLTEPISWISADVIITAGPRGGLFHRDLNSTAHFGARFFRTVEMVE